MSPRDVTVHPAAFSLNLASDTVCSPLQLTLPAIPGAENLTWNFGDGTQVPAKLQPTRGKTQEMT